MAALLKWFKPARRGAAAYGDDGHPPGARGNAAYADLDGPVPNASAERSSRAQAAGSHAFQASSGATLPRVHFTDLSAPPEAPTEDGGCGHQLLSHKAGAALLSPLGGLTHSPAQIALFLLALVLSVAMTFLSILQQVQPLVTLRMSVYGGHPAALSQGAVLAQYGLWETVYPGGFHGPMVARRTARTALNGNVMEEFGRPGVVVAAEVSSVLCGVVPFVILLLHGLTMFYRGKVDADVKVLRGGVEEAEATAQAMHSRPLSNASGNRSAQDGSELERLASVPCVSGHTGAEGRPSQSYSVENSVAKLQRNSSSITGSPSQTLSVSDGYTPGGSGGNYVSGGGAEAGHTSLVSSQETEPHAAVGNGHRLFHLSEDEDGEINEVAFRLSAREQTMRARQQSEAWSRVYQQQKQLGYRGPRVLLKASANREQFYTRITTMERVSIALLVLLCAQAGLAATAMVGSMLYAAQLREPAPAHTGQDTFHGLALTVLPVLLGTALGTAALYGACAVQRIRACRQLHCEAAGATPAPQPPSTREGVVGGASVRTAADTRAIPAAPLLSGHAHHPSDAATAHAHVSQEDASTTSAPRCTSTVPRPREGHGASPTGSGGGGGEGEVFAALSPAHSNGKNLPPPTWPAPSRPPAVYEEPVKPPRAQAVPTRSTMPPTSADAANRDGLPVLYGLPVALPGPPVETLQPGRGLWPLFAESTAGEGGYVLASAATVPYAKQPTAASDGAQGGVGLHPRTGVSPADGTTSVTAGGGMDGEDARRGGGGDGGDDEGGQAGEAAAAPSSLSPDEQQQQQQPEHPHSQPPTRIYGRAGVYTTAPPADEDEVTAEVLHRSHHELVHEEG